MNETFDETSNTLAAMTAELVAAYVSNNPVPAAELPALIVRVHGAISGLVAGTPTAAGAAPQVEVEKPSAPAFTPSSTSVLIACMSAAVAGSRSTPRWPRTSWPPRAPTPTKPTSSNTCPSDFPSPSPRGLSCLKP